MQWSRERLTALLTPLPATGLDAALGTATITQLKSLTGEVRNRASATLPATRHCAKGRTTCACRT